MRKQPKLLLKAPLAKAPKNLTEFKDSLAGETDEKKRLDVKYAIMIEELRLEI